MSLYVDVTIVDGDRIVVLNRNYTKEQIRERLLNGDYPDEFISELLEKGVYLEKPIKIKCNGAEGTITTQVHNYWRYIYWGEYVTINPDASFSKHQRNMIDQLFLKLKNYLGYVVWWLLGRQY